MKDPLLINKILASVLTALFVMLMIDFITDTLIFQDDDAHEQKREDGDKKQFAYDIYVEENDQADDEPKAAPKAASISSLIAGGDIASGVKSSKKCMACHTSNKGGVNRIGPNLWDVVARARGTSKGFNYSEALLASGGTWDYESLNQFLFKPRDYLVGTKMNFAGIKNDQERADLVLWLRSLSDNPAPLP